MAEYCSKCSPMKIPDLWLFSIALRLKRGYFRMFICEGCNIRGLEKDENGKLYLLKEVNKEIAREKTKLLKLW